VFISISNEKQTDSNLFAFSIIYTLFSKFIIVSFETLGQNLAFEVDNFLTHRKYLKDVRISFIGFSMGGIIIREALTRLDKYKDRFYTFMTMSSPHLGRICLISNQRIYV